MEGISFNGTYLTTEIYKTKTSHLTEKEKTLMKLFVKKGT